MSILFFLGLLMNSFSYAILFEEVNNPTGQVNFDPLKEYDFNGDKIFDQVTCKGSSLTVTIKDGKNKNILFSWVKPSNGTSNKRIISDCEVIEIQKGFPSIILSSYTEVPGQGARGLDTQYILLNDKGKWKGQAVSFSDGSKFNSAARSVSCAQYPQNLVKAGYKDGVLCFWAGYDSLLPSGSSEPNGTFTALLKIEAEEGKVIFKDLTPTADLIWEKGVKGTPLSTFPKVKLCSGGDKRYDGLHMMTSSFMDYDDDGYVDLITAGQHASLRAHKLVLDTSRPEGIRYITTNITNAQDGMSEYMKIISLSKLETSFPVKCLFVSGEVSNSCNSTHNHLRCYTGSEWELVDLPGSKFSSDVVGGTLSGNGEGSLFIKADKYTGGKYQATHYYEAPYDGLGIGAVTLVDLGDSLELKGWVCRQNILKKMNVVISSQSITESNKILYYNKPTNLASEPPVWERCMVKKDLGFRFSFVIPKKSLDGSGKFFIYARDLEEAKNYLVKEIKIPN